MSSEAYIRRQAKRMGLDPRAVVAVAMGEGGLRNRKNDIGDKAGGGSYGPFQLYAQGALPAKYRGNSNLADTWAWSPEGINYALRQMSGVAKGLSGEAAIRAIITKFERPADPQGSIANALGRLGNIGGGSKEAPVSSSSPGRPLAAPSGTPDNKLAFMHEMLEQIRSKNPSYQQAVQFSQEPAETAHAPGYRQPQAVESPQNPSPGQRPPGKLFAQLKALGLTGAITSGERSHEANASTGGSPTSYHLPGGPQAYDLRIDDPKIPKLIAYARKNPGYFKEFFGPVNWHIKNGKIRKGAFPDHGDHYHVAR